MSGTAYAMAPPGQQGQPYGGWGDGGGVFGSQVAGRGAAGGYGFETQQHQAVQQYQAVQQQLAHRVARQLIRQQIIALLTLHQPGVAQQLDQLQNVQVQAQSHPIVALLAQHPAIQQATQQLIQQLHQSGVHHLAQQAAQQLVQQQLMQHLGQQQFGPQQQLGQQQQFGQQLGPQQQQQFGMPQLGQQFGVPQQQFGQQFGVPQQQFGQQMPQQQYPFGLAGNPFNR